MPATRFACALLLLATTCLAQQPQPSPRERANAAAATLQHWYVQRTGLYTTTGWWNAANAITAIVDLSRATHSQTYAPTLANTFTQAQIVVPKAEQVGALDKMTGAPNFLNDYYDDEGWWALAWVDAYDLTHDTRYLAMAQTIFQDMSGGWDSTCGGGIWWSKERTYKNAIANELFFSVATHLAARAQAADRDRYADWATKEWAWFQNSGMINNQHLVNDGLTIDKASGQCTNNGRTVWTYNQGVVLGALAEWSRINPDTKLLLDARILADAGLANLTDTAGVLHDPCEPTSCGADAPQFKGIFVRNLRALQHVVHEPRYTAFFETNADSIWLNDRNTAKRFGGTDNQLGLVWSGPPKSIDASTQSSALDALTAAIPD
ncbi:glycoside hydrolase family 76 protein [Terriglobus aquaticus]|uniref:Glycoside hydrolase family 76 protein n=1 Tax=Terriglobus aquaticus TaxID=940139 RepID=A0ABW9KMI9_9BACT|nr:glycoside hydrolase family 76 protein [Terriglobus aquaticus]